MSKQQASPATSAESSVPNQQPTPIAGGDRTSVSAAERTPDRYSSSAAPGSMNSDSNISEAPSGASNAASSASSSNGASVVTEDQPTVTTGPGGPADTMGMPAVTNGNAAPSGGPSGFGAPGHGPMGPGAGGPGGPAPGGYGPPPPVGPGSVTAGINKSQVAEAVRAARQSVTAAASRNARRNRLQLRKIDPWSVMKFSFAASLVLFIAFVVSTAILYTVLDAMGVFDSINETVKSLTTTTDEGGQESSFVINAKTVIGGAALLGAVNMVLFTALATLGSFVYNVCADLAGGIELTLSERD